MHGIPRTTQDVDIVADLHPEHIESLAAACRRDFHVDEDMIRDAVRRRATFNLIHLGSMFKVDVFVLSDDPAQLREMDRRQSYLIDPQTSRSLTVASAEDIILMKLHWYRLGEAVSDRQWNDALGVLKVQSKELNYAYLQRSAEQMGLGELLERAMEEAGVGPQQRL